MDLFAPLTRTQRQKLALRLLKAQLSEIRLAQFIDNTYGVEHDRGAWRQVFGVARELGEIADDLVTA